MISIEPLIEEIDIFIDDVVAEAVEQVEREATVRPITEHLKMVKVARQVAERCLNIEENYETGLSSEGEQ